MSKLERPPMKSDPDEILSSLHMNPESFNLFVHQNYLNFFKSLDDIATASAYASDSDLLLKHYEVIEQPNFFFLFLFLSFFFGGNPVPSSSTQTLKERESMTMASSSLFCRGLLFAREDHQVPNFAKMYKPQWHNVQKEARETKTKMNSLFSNLLLSSIETSGISPFCSLDNQSTHQP